MLDIKIVGIKIASLRKSNGYSQEKLAEILCISPQAISKWENGHTLPETAILPVLAQIFRCNIDEILMPAYTLDEKIEEVKPTLLEQQAENIANYVMKKIENKIVSKNNIGLSDDTIAEAINITEGDIGNFTINRGKESRAKGKICTGITITSSHKSIKLTELIYHKRFDEFNGYILLNEHITELPKVYYIDSDKKLILLEDLGDDYIKGYDYDEENENGEIIRENLNTYLRAAANLHSAFWENEDAFQRKGLDWRFETKENLLAHISCCERDFKKYRRNEETGNIPKDGGVCGKNNISKRELDYFNEAVQYLKTEYIRLVDTRFNVNKNVTIIHGDLHPGALLMSKTADRQIKFSGLQAVRMGLCTEDLAMLIALHMSVDKKTTDIQKLKKKDVIPMLDYYYSCLNEITKDYSYETFMNDYKISIAENMFFTIRLINRGINDFRMRDKAIRAFETFILENE